MKNTLIFSLLFMCFCTFAPLSTLLIGCEKVEAQETITTWNDSLAIVGDIPYMITLQGKVEILRVENANKLYSWFLTERKYDEEYPEIFMADWQDSSHVVVEFRNKFYYHTHSYINAVLQGILISESDYPIYICERENLFVGEDYNLNLNNISEPLQTYCKSLQQFEAHIRPTDNPSEFRIWFGGWDAKKGEYSFFKSFIIIT